MKPCRSVPAEVAAKRFDIRRLHCRQGISRIAVPTFWQGM